MESQNKKFRNEYLYIYGITNKDNTKINVKGLKNQSIKKINFKDVSVLTSPYPTLHPILKEDEAMQHSGILKKLAKKITIIPMSFGTVFKTQQILERVLLKSYPTVKEVLGLIDNKIELGVKVVKKESDNINDTITKKILEPLDKLSAKGIKGDKFSDRLLLNYSFLVERNDFSKFSNKIAELEGKYKNLKFLYTGPWPPYSFVNINIRGRS